MVRALVEPSKVTWATTWWTPGVAGTCTVRGCPPPPTVTPLTVMVTFLIRLPLTATLTVAPPCGPWTRVAVPPPVLPVGFFAVPVVPFDFFPGVVVAGVPPTGVVVVPPVPPVPVPPPAPLPGVLPVEHL